jgi:hypothetical protein
MDEDESVPVKPLEFREWLRGWAKPFITTENTESTEKSKKNLCALCELGVKSFGKPTKLAILGVY